MTYYKFKDKDVLNNRVKAFPSIKFNIYSGSVFYNNHNKISGSFTDSIGNTPPGHISLYELNIDRAEGTNNPIYPFITKDGSLTSFKTITTSSFNSDYKFGDVVNGSYPLSASISNDFYILSRSVAENRKVNALKNTLSKYLILSPQFSYESNLTGATWNKGVEPLRMISIPSIFYGSSIQKGSVSLKYYYTGSFVAELRDDKKNGELRQTSQIYDGGAASGSVAGVVLYDQGVILLTGSWDLRGVGTPTTIFPSVSSSASSSVRHPRWYDFGLTGSSAVTIPQINSSSFEMSLNGTNYIPTVTMFATAPKGEVNYSNNPTALEYNSDINCLTNYSGSNQFVESSDLRIKNISSASYSDPAATFEKTVYINSVGIYDENKNLIAVAKMAKPVRKRNSDDLTFKLKLDF